MEKIVEKLRKNGFTVTEFDTKEAAADYLTEGLHGKTIGMGGSMTLAALDVYDRLRADNTVYWHQIVPGDETIAGADNAQVYITSANAISEEGYILNIDGRGNRVAGTLMQKERVIFVVGAVDGVCHDCASPDRICNALVVMWKKPFGCKEMEVVLIHQDLGY